MPSNLSVDQLPVRIYRLGQNQIFRIFYDWDESEGQFEVPVKAETGVCFKDCVLVASGIIRCNPVWYKDILWYPAVMSAQQLDDLAQKRPASGLVYVGDTSEDWDSVVRKIIIDDARERAKKNPEPEVQPSPPPSPAPEIPEGVSVWRDADTCVWYVVARTGSGIYAYWRPTLASPSWELSNMFPTSESLRSAAAVGRIVHEQNRSTSVPYIVEWMRACSYAAAALLTHSKSDTVSK